ncbi:MAG: hypothetical protein U0Q18_35160 [Bryobacteraceae bacterium]
MSQIYGSTRRTILLLATGTGISPLLRLYAGDSEFWNKKEPGEWSGQEIEKLTTHSPWAREVTASTPGYTEETSDMGRVGGTAGPGAPGMGGPGLGGRPGSLSVPGGRGMGRGRGGGVPMQFSGVVRWESAKPLLEANKKPLPEAFANYYVISVSGIPVLANGRQDTEDGENPTAVSKGLSEDVLERIKNFTYLEPKGKAPAQPGIVQKGPARGAQANSIWFGFSREYLQLTPADKDVIFTTRLGRLDVKAKFVLKDMMYHKELAL